MSGQMVEKKWRWNVLRIGVVILWPKCTLKFMYILYLGWGTLCSCRGVRLGVRCVSAWGSFVKLRVLCLIVNYVNSLVKRENNSAISSWPVFLPLFYFLHCERFFRNIIEIRWLLCCYSSHLFRYFPVN